MNKLRPPLGLALSLCLLSCSLLQAGKPAEQAGRQPVGPGQFYPEKASTLRLALETMLREASAPRVPRPVALVVPHAAYVYSGQIAADGYRQASGQPYDIVVILGTNHTTPGFDGISIYSGSGYRTPLGVAEVATDVVAALVKGDPDCKLNDAVHAQEHSVEVQVPFVQQLFPKAKIVAVVVSSTDLGVCSRFGRVLAETLKTRQALIVASSDLSHYPSADQAVAVDKSTLEAIAGMDPAALHSRFLSQTRYEVPNLLTNACGLPAIMAAMVASRALGATRGVVISYANSGDVAVGDPSRVVGYGSVVFTTGEGASDTTVLNQPAAPSAGGALEAADKKALLALARETIRRYVTTDTLPLVRGFDAKLLRAQGAFVTLKKGGELRGCIGHLLPDTPLARIVSAMALEAAVADPRFGKLQPDELSQIEIEIAALTPLKSIASPSEIVVGRDGVLYRDGSKGAVFLPNVAPEQGWNRIEMLDNLCLKAGLPADRWRKSGKFDTFQAEAFGEREFK
jgi:MEMO1 family protein